MNKIDESLDAFWISKLGVERLAELPGGSDGEGAQEKAINVVRQLGDDREQFHDLLWAGFDGYFHQWVYARTLGKKSMAGHLAGLPVGKSEGEVEWWSQQVPSKGRVRVLAGIRKEMQFLEADRVVRQTVVVPVMAEALPSYLRVRVLTLQSTVTTWSDLLEIPIRRILTPVVEKELAEQLYRTLDPFLPGLGDMQDLSVQAIALMKDTDAVYTYSGTFGVKKVGRTVGRTQHTAEGDRLGRRRKPLHAVMKSEFEN
jgi:hypothetical protein